MPSPSYLSAFAFAVLAACSSGSRGSDPLLRSSWIGSTPEQQGELTLFFQSVSGDSVAGAASIKPCINTPRVGGQFSGTRIGDQISIAVVIEQPAVSLDFVLIMTDHALRGAYTATDNVCAAAGGFGNGGFQQTGDVLLCRVDPMVPLDVSGEWTAGGDSADVAIACLTQDGDDVTGAFDFVGNFTPCIAANTTAAFRGQLHYSFPGDPSMAQIFGVLSVGNTEFSMSGIAGDGLSFQLISPGATCSSGMTFFRTSPPCGCGQRERADFSWQMRETLYIVSRDSAIHEVITPEGVSYTVLEDGLAEKR